MNLSKLITEFWKELFPENVVYLSIHRLERSKKYPGVGFRLFKDYLLHKQWLITEINRNQRKQHNDAILQKYKLGIYKEIPEESK